ncbi:MAG: alpha/beta hydrolase [Tannerellaceae bacterium]|jgi:alpha-beta hydrolase superfamily lysophospholipase|nr:alpha/beta hydrolase [Tannerellaceae bacterium]
MKLTILTFLLFNIVTVFSINPEKQYVINPEYYNINIYNTAIVNTVDNANIFLYDIAGKQKKEDICIILSYGDAGNLSYYFGYAGKLSELGYSVVLFDYRGFGKSSDFAANKELLFCNEYALDLSAVIKYCKQKYVSHKIGVLAFSMGTIITTICSYDNSIDFIIAENYATNLSDTLIKLNTGMTNKIHLPDNFDLNKYVNKMTSNNQPLLLFNSIKDKAINKEDYRIFLSNNSFLLIDYDNEHGHGYETLRNDYFNIIANFINKYVK